MTLHFCITSNWDTLRDIEKITENLGRKGTTIHTKQKNGTNK
jgi:hypothetical protein